MGLPTYVYVDGFNLYFGLGASKNEYRWLDVRKLCELLLPPNDVLCVKYFTSEVELRPDDPAKLERQQTFIRALQATGVQVYYGKFLTRKRWLKLVREPEMARVYVTSEKASDVNLGAHILLDGFEKRYEVAVVVSDDTDLLTPMRMVRDSLGCVVGVLNPQGHKPHEDMIEVAHFIKQIRKGPLSACQLPDTLHDEEGEILKPEDW